MQSFPYSDTDQSEFYPNETFLLLKLKLSMRVNPFAQSKGWQECLAEGKAVSVPLVAQNIHTCAFVNIENTSSSQHDILFFAISLFPTILNVDSTCR